MPDQPAYPFHLPIGPDSPWLAPLAGFSDLPFRLLCREMGCAVACTEMVSAKGLLYQSQGTTDLLRTCAEDTPLVVQLFGSEPEVIAEALSWLLEQGYRYFDLNAGCPVRKVVKTGAGAGLVQKPNQLFSILSRMADLAGPGRFGVKLRSGWSSGQEILAWVKELDSLGLGWVSLHPRTAKQAYSGRADWDVLDAVSRQLALPVLASGDLLTARDGVRCMQSTMATGVMFARGTLADPGIFATYLQIVRGEEDEAPGPHKGRQQALNMARRHIALIRKYGKGDRDLFRMRTIIPRYLRGFQGVKNIRKQVVACTTWLELMNCLDEVEAGMK
ncbi:MAG: tRNA-dihydrouridine synthase family protein [Desulfovermiculus sp.]|nr:tRNA-dihydrouridine synthase family protein [Desulfovermiculus sp.]